MTYRLRDVEFGTVTEHATLESAHAVGKFVSSWGQGRFAIEDDRGRLIGTYDRGSWSVASGGES